MQPQLKQSCHSCCAKTAEECWFPRLLSELSRQLHSWTFLGIKAFSRSSELIFRKVCQLTGQEQTCSRINQFFYVSFTFTSSSPLSIKSTLSSTSKISNSGQTEEKQECSFSFLFGFPPCNSVQCTKPPTVEHECE